MRLAVPDFRPWQGVQQLIGAFQDALYSYVPLSITDGRRVRGRNLSLVDAQMYLIVLRCFCGRLIQIALKLARR